MTWRSPEAGGEDPQIEVVAGSVGQSRRWVVVTATCLMLSFVVGCLWWAAGSGSDDRAELAPPASGVAVTAAETAPAPVTSAEVPASSTADSVSTSLVTESTAPSDRLVASPGSLYAWCLKQHPDPCNIKDSNCTSVLNGPAVLTMPNIIGWKEDRLVSWITIVAVVYPRCAGQPRPKTQLIYSMGMDACVTDASKMDRVFRQSIPPGTTVSGVNFALTVGLTTVCALPPIPSFEPPPTPPPTPESTTSA